MLRWWKEKAAKCFAYYLQNVMSKACIRRSLSECKCGPQQKAQASNNFLFNNKNKVQHNNFGSFNLRYHTQAQHFY